MTSFAQGASALAMLFSGTFRAMFASRFWFFWFGLLLGSFLCLTSSQAQPTAEMKMSADLKCTIAADDKLVHDAFTLTTDDLGRPVVSGPGYIRTLIDENNDGIFEKAVLWQTVEQGAQGLWREGNALYYVADGGLWKSVDANGDLTADGSSVKILSVPTGGEHDTHAIRRGPDGFWYITNGNFSTARMRELTNDKDSPISSPKMGCIWRISPDFKTRSVWAHGFRNTYDFDFLPTGELVTYDSDEERETSLPAYNPTRVYAVSVGSDGGWVAPSWIENDTNQFMPLNLASLGRGSPTGVCVYQHDALGSRFRDAVLVLDWTFGRVIAVFPKSQFNQTKDSATLFGSGLCQWEVLMEPSGTEGFAPTDLTIDDRGDVLVITGGRGTKGTLYRISPSNRNEIAKDGTANTQERLVDHDAKQNQLEQNDAPKLSSEPSLTNTAILRLKGLAFVDQTSVELDTNRSESLSKILTANCPWEAWSRSQWLPLLKTQTKADLIDFWAGRIQFKESVSTGVELAALKMRAAQVLVHAQVDIKADDIQTALQQTGDASQAAVWYLLGRGNLGIPSSQIQTAISQPWTNPTANNQESWADLLGGVATRNKWEAIGMRRWSVQEIDSYAPHDAFVAKSLNQIRLWALSRQSQSTISNEFMIDVANVAYLPSTMNTNRFDAAAFDRLAQSIRDGKYKSDPAQIMLALAFVQKSLGDARSMIDDSRSPDSASILDGYRSLRFDSIPQNVRAGWVKYCLNLADAAKASGQESLELQAVRTAAMFRCDSSEVLDRLLLRINDASHPTADINVLCAIATSAFKPNQTQCQKIAEGFAGVSEKIATRHLPTDNRWSTRMQQLLEALGSIDSTFVPSLVSTLTRTNATSLEWINWLPLQQQRESANLVAKQMASGLPSSWTSSQIQVVGRFVLPSDLAAKIRSVVENSIESPLRRQPVTAKQDDSNLVALIEFLAKTPTTADYESFLLATSSPNRQLIQHGWSGLRKLPIVDAQREFDAISLLMAAHHAFPVSGYELNQVTSRLRNVVTRLKFNPLPQTNATWETWQAYLQPKLHSSNTKSNWDELQQPQAPWTDVVKSAQSISGDEDRGAILFKRGQCHQCHNSSQAIGPSLNGVTRRFSYEDLFRAIYEPSRDISDRFRATKFLTTDGQILVGMVSIDNDREVVLTLPDGSIKKIASDDIEERSESTQSLMPENLLQGWTPAQVADLYAYLRRQ